MTDSSSKLIESAALALCRANREAPDGARVRFLNDGMHEQTFLQMRSADAVAVIRDVRNSMQAHAETLPIEEYGPWRRVVEWLDEQSARNETP